MENYQGVDKLAPIVLFTYNRLSETIQTVEALKKNFLSPESELFIFSDGPKDEAGMQKVEKVRDYLKTIDGFKTVIIYESPQNKGLANSIIDGVTKIIERSGRVIVLEDDLITSRNFLDFMNQALIMYENIEKIKSISGYSLDVSIKDNSDFFFHNRPYSWGWGTWANKWKTEIFHDNYITTKELEKNKNSLSEIMGQDTPQMILRSIQKKNDSWYSKWIYHHFKCEEVTVYPKKSKVKNIGFSDKGTHCKTINVHKIVFDEDKKRNFTFVDYSGVNIDIKNNFLKYFSKSYKIFYRLNLLKEKQGRKEVYKELKNKLL